MDKKPRLGSDPLEWIKDTRKGEDSKTTKQKASKPAKQQARKTVSQADSNPLRKAIYYIRPDLIKELKHLGVDTERDLSELVNEAIEDLISKHRGKQWKRSTPEMFPSSEEALKHFPDASEWIKTPPMGEEVIKAQGKELEQRKSKKNNPKGYSR